MLMKRFEAAAFAAGLQHQKIKSCRKVDEHAATIWDVWWTED